MPSARLGLCFLVAFSLVSLPHGQAAALQGAPVEVVAAATPGPFRVETLQAPTALAPGETGTFVVHIATDERAPVQVIYDVVAIGSARSTSVPTDAAPIAAWSIEVPPTAVRDPGQDDDQFYTLSSPPAAGELARSPPTLSALRLSRFASASSMALGADVGHASTRLPERGMSSDFSAHLGTAAGARGHVLLRDDSPPSVVPPPFDAWPPKTRPSDARQAEAPLGPGVGEISPGAAGIVTFHVTLLDAATGSDGVIFGLRLRTTGLAEPQIAALPRVQAVPAAPSGPTSAAFGPASALSGLLASGGAVAVVAGWRTNRARSPADGRNPGGFDRGGGDGGPEHSAGAGPEAMPSEEASRASRADGRSGFGGGLLPFLGLYTRLARSEVLAQETRERIYRHLQQRPGAHLGELRRATGLSTGVLLHHMGMLEQHHFVTSRKEQHRRCFYPSGARPPEPAAPAPTTTERRLLDALAAGWLSQRQLAAHLGISQQGASYHLVRLRQRGLVEGDRTTGEWRYRAAGTPG